MKQGLTQTKQTVALGCLVCSVVISGLVIGYAARQIEERGLSQFIASSEKPEDIQAPKEIAEVEATEENFELEEEVAIETEEEVETLSTMPPAPDMGAIFAQQREEESLADEPYEAVGIDLQTTASISTPATPYIEVATSTPVQANILLAHAGFPKGFKLKDLPIPAPSPRKKNAETSIKKIDKPRRARKGTPDVLVLGDSQISVSAGPSYQKFFSNIPAICNVSKDQIPASANIDFTQTASLGVRSTSLHSWVARSGAAKGSICDVDKKWGVNAGAWGIGGNPKRKYVQIGKGKDYKFCKPRSSAFEGMFAKGYYKPKLLVMAFLGNSADRWARSKKNALKDVKATLAQIPKDTACIFMTSAPVYSKRVNDVRVKAQKNIAAAFKETGNRCTVVQGLNPQIRKEVEGNKTYFRKTKSGKIADKFHPNASAIKKFVKYNTPALCQAIRKQLG